MESNFPALELCIEETEGRFIQSSLVFEGYADLLRWWENETTSRVFEWCLWDSRDDLPLRAKDLIDRFREEFGYSNFNRLLDPSDDEEDDEAVQAHFFSIDYEQWVTDGKIKFSSERWNRRMFCWCGSELYGAYKRKMKVEVEVADCANHEHVIMRYVEPARRPDLRGIRAFIEHEKKLGVFPISSGYRPG